MPSSAITLSVNGRRYRLASNQTIHLTATSGARLAISVSIVGASDAQIRDVWIAATGRSWGLGGVHTIDGQAVILAHHAGSLSANDSVQTAWTAEPAFGSSSVGLSVAWTVGTIGTADQVASISLR